MTTYGSGTLPLALQAPAWEVWLERYDGSALLPLTDMVNRGHLYVSLNGLGSCSLELSLDKLQAAGYKDIPTDSLLEFRRKHGAVKSFSFYKRKTTRTQDGLIVAGMGLNHLLKRRVIAYYTGSSFAKKTAALDDMMKAIVKENCYTEAVDYEDGTTVVPERDYSQIIDFTVQPETTLAPSASVAFAWDNVYETLVKLAEKATQQGTRLFFEVVRVSDNAFQFQTFANAYGIDRRGQQIFSAAFGNLTDTELTLDRSNEVNYLYVAGKGREEYRKIEEVQNVANVQHSPLNRIEGVYNATNTDDNALASVGYQALERNKPLRLFKGQLQDAEGSRYGLDWDLGDLLDAQDGEEEFEIMVTGVEFDFSGGKTSIKGRFQVLDE